MAANVETYIRIGTLTGDGSTNVLSFTDIPQTYTDLVVRGTMSTTANASTYARIRLNNDTATNYVVQRMSTTGQSNFQGTRAQTSAFFIGDVPHSASGHVSSHEVNIFSYCDVAYLYPTLTYASGSPIDTQFWLFSSATYTNLTAINRIDFYFDSGNPTTDSKLSLYGILRA